MAPVIPVRRYNYYNRNDREKISMVPVIPVRRYNYYNRNDREKISMVPVIPVRRYNYYNRNDREKISNGPCDTINIFFFLDGFTPKEIHPKLTMVYGNSLSSISTIKKRQLYLNVVTRRPKMTHVKDAQRLQPYRKGAQYCLRPWKRKGEEYLARRIRDAKALHKVGAAIAECRSKANVQTTSAGMFGSIQEGSHRICAAILQPSMQNIRSE
ncbi:hypothetical protein LAZ67_11002555 [Cordylochernes scorpioides]|uniref:Uncharacterized protein n=1 Tax=Cordylochernes scorpioides TaxID=51811 RepID=A0ABY6L2T0_9ARAC|nr:hypothetical protein LAZ67_11002555 [Cordylochernes scorpioides]